MREDPNVGNNCKGHNFMTLQLHAKVEPRSWIIDFICSNHMMGDKDDPITLEKYDGGSIKFTKEKSTLICGIGISIDGKKKIDGVYYVEDLRHGLLSVSQMCNRGYEIVFIDTKCMIKKGKLIKLVAEGIMTSGNVYYIDDKSGNRCYLIQSSECWLWNKIMGHVNFNNMIKINKFKE